MNLRKAISYSIDREALVKQVLGDGSVVSTGLIPSDMVKVQQRTKTLQRSWKISFL